MTGNDETVFTPKQVAEKLQMNLETIYRYLNSGRLKGTKLSPKAWRISQENLDELLRSNHDAD